MALTVALVAWTLAATLLVLAAGRIRACGFERPFAQLILLFPLVFGHLWFLARPGAPAGRMWLLGGMLALAAAVMLLRGPRRRSGVPSLSGRALLAADAVMILGPALLGLAVGNGIAWKSAGNSLLLYPLYAAVQLAVFMALPAPRLQTMGMGPRATAAFCAVVFGLFHWPSPVVMLATGGCMFVWCRAWLGGRPFLRIALVMGLAATTFSQFLPDDWTGHVRIGPTAPRTAAVMDLAFAPGHIRTPARTWLAGAYPASAGRAATAAELDRWEQALAPLQGADTAWMFMTSEEYRNQATADGREFPPSGRTHWSRAGETWESRVLPFATEEYLRENGATFSGLVEAFYRDILDRQAAEAEVAAWSTDLSVGQRLRLSRWLLHHQTALAQAPFDSAGITDLSRPY